MKTIGIGRRRYLHNVLRRFKSSFREGCCCVLHDCVVEERMDHIAVQIGDAIGKLHDGGLVGGDLTTSNMLIRNNTNQLVGLIS
ncbi:EKC/KEOPS complex subunit bud32 [Camellia lanceoleosa]|uniref:EKC/KEOPS complex subunit bud32 n=1 Tax=Camellia lanceoleosa TaxID=1840588 RepID=A0ACC0I1Z7_9ERIC|nr:EKC/KEOPS complex subunit bud32 [Camellia lanceoleosa]